MTFYKYIMLSLRLIDDDNKIRAGGRKDKKIDFDTGDNPQLVMTVMTWKM